MAKIYAKNTWTDEILAGAERYDTLADDGTPIESNIQINLATSVAQAGTAVDATKMNNIENGIDALDTLVAAGGASIIHAATSKTPPIDADEIPLIDSAASYGLKKLTWASLKATLKTYLDTLYLAIVAPGTNGNVLTSNGSAWTSAVPAVQLSKASSSEVATGTDDAKYVTAKSIKDSVNVPNAAPSTAGNVLTSVAGAWVSATPTVVASGTYTPTLTEVTNCPTLGTYQAQWLRVGNVVTVSGQINIDPGATGDVNLAISLPAAQPSNITALSNVAGTANSYSTTECAAIYGDTVNDRANLRFIATSITAKNWWYTFTYLVQ